MNITGDNPIAVMASINNEAGGLIFVSVLVLLWIIIFFRNNNEAARDAAVGATYIVCIVGALFGIAGLLYDRTFSVLFFLMVGAIVMLVNRPNGG